MERVEGIMAAARATEKEEAIRAARERIRTMDDKEAYTILSDAQAVLECMALGKNRHPWNSAWGMTDSFRCLIDVLEKRVVRCIADKWREQEKEQA